MKLYGRFTWIAIALMMLALVACSASTANISDAKMARDKEGKDATTTFAPTDTFYSVVNLANAPDDTKVRAVWTAVSAEGIDPNKQLQEVPITSGDAQLNFKLTNSADWPTGKYRIDLYLNDGKDPVKTLDFEVR
jgi:hypothetical protein